MVVIARIESARTRRNPGVAVIEKIYGHRQPEKLGRHFRWTRDF